MIKFGKVPDGIAEGGMCSDECLLVTTGMKSEGRGPAEGRMESAAATWTAERSLMNKWLSGTNQHTHIHTHTHTCRRHLDERGVRSGRCGWVNA